MSAQQQMKFGPTTLALAVAVSLAAMQTRLIAVPDPTGVCDGFLPGVTIPSTVFSPSNVVIGDFDSDGRSDVVISGSVPIFGSGLYAYRNLGGSSFAELPIIPGVGLVRATSLLDIDSDGDLDVATIVADGTNYTLKTYRYSHQLGFTFFQSTPLVGGTSQFYRLHPAELTGDELLDLLVWRVGFESLSIYRNVGPGVFIQFDEMQINARDISTGDVDGDLDTDILYSVSGGHSITLLRRNADGITFNSEIIYGGGDEFSFYLADFNNDVLPDLIRASANGNALIAPNNGQGGFSDFGVIYATSSSTSFRLGDVNADGLLDVIVSTMGTATHLLNQGGFVFMPDETDVTMAGTPFPYPFGEFDNSPLPDLCRILGENVALFANLGSPPSFGTKRLAAGTEPTSPVVVDLDGDGDKDIVAANFGGSTIDVYETVGPLQWATPVKWLAHTSPRQLAVADFNSDGRLDIATANYGSINVSILYQSPSVSLDFSERLLVPSGFSVNTSALSAADIDDDEDIDLLVTSQSGGALRVIRNNGALGFQNEPVSSIGGTHLNLKSSDIDNDGDIDALVGENGIARIFRNDGTGAFTYDGFVPSIGITTGMVIGDFNVDHRWDIAMTSQNENLLIVALNDGTGSFPESVVYPSGQLTFGICTGDWNGDRIPDIATTNAQEDTVNLYINDGHGNMTAAGTHPVGVYPRDIAASDLNDDGLVDAVITNGNSDDLTIVLNRGEDAHRGDCDCSGDIELSDYVELATCLSGPQSNFAASECHCADVNWNGHVDLVDFARFQRHFTGGLD